MSHFEKGNKSIEFIINCAIDEYSQKGDKAPLNSIIFQRAECIIFSPQKRIYFAIVLSIHLKKSQK
mgnify:CR=1 FL=1